jgi:squalene-hopene/tetraprenyl-beta-curcumene cyclase
MKTPRLEIILLTLSAFLPVVAFAQPVKEPDISFRNEVQHAIDRGLDWLKANQNPTNNAWSTADQPAVTALALTAFMGEPSGAAQKNPPPGVQRGYDFINSCAKPDGAIYNKGLQNYNTAICVMALLAANNKSYEPVILRARQWLINQQVAIPEGQTDSAFNGGVGYEHGNHSDMNNTFTALEALYYSKQLASDKALAGAKDLNWQAAIQFIQSCQNLPSANKQPWVSDEPQDKGGFIYSPGNTKANTVTNAQGRVALRSYGSISYAGLLSYIYCDVNKQDSRVNAVYDWLRENYTVDENPGMGPQGLYYYLHMMTKGLTIYGGDSLQLKDGRNVDWRHEVAMKLINLQKTDGSWSNENNRWWEHDPALVTSYSVMSLEMLYHQL